MPEIFDKLFVVLHRREMIRTLKPQFVWFYRFYNGDMQKIARAVERMEVTSDLQLEEDLRGVSLDNYIILLEKNFNKICLERHYDPENCYVIELKPASKNEENN